MECEQIKLMGRSQGAGIGSGRREAMLGSMNVQSLEADVKAMLRSREDGAVEGDH